MFGNAITIFRLAGFDVRIDLSWLIVFALVVWSLASGVFPDVYPGLNAPAYWGMGIAGALLLFFSILLHELAHAAVGRRHGLQVRSITLFVFGGVADLHEEPPTAEAELKMALAGPATSLAIAGVLFLAAILADIAGLPRIAWVVAGYLAAMNLVLFLFNMIPAFPLDGGRVLRAWLWYRSGDIRSATRRASVSGSFFGILIMALGVLFLFAGNFIGGLWWILIGFFIRNAAHLSYSQLFIRDALEGKPVRSFMTPDPVKVPRSISIRELVNEYFYRSHHKLYPVVDDDRLIGCVTTGAVRQLPMDEWDRQTVGSIAESCSPENAVAADEDALEALVRMTRSKRSRLVVLEGDRLVGVVTLKDLLSFLSVKMEIEARK
ncbi:MAG: site-2 protease family protein [Thermoanaerobaculia bacterium]